MCDFKLGFYSSQSNARTHPVCGLWVNFLKIVLFLTTVLLLVSSGCIVVILCAILIHTHRVHLKIKTNERTDTKYRKGNALTKQAVLGQGENHGGSNKASEWKRKTVHKCAPHKSSEGTRTQTTNSISGSRPRSFTRGII